MLIIQQKQQRKRQYEAAGTTAAIASSLFPSDEHSAGSDDKPAAQSLDPVEVENSDAEETFHTNYVEQDAYGIVDTVILMSNSC